MSEQGKGKRWNIEVTEGDIERAHRNDSYVCVVAQAIARTIPDATRIEVDSQTIRFTRNGERLLFLTPYAVQGYVIAYDAGDAIESFSFQLRDPVRVRRVVKTARGRAGDRAADRARRAVTKSSRGALEDSANTPDEPREAAKAAYADATKQSPTPRTRTVSSGRKPPPRVFKRKKRSYGHRLLRINQEDG